MSKVTTREQLSREQINIQREVEYIVRRAAERDARVVTLGPLVFFSTETGDAWLLDPSDHLALCLARDGDPRPVNLTESEGAFAIGWEMTYQISGGRFIVADQSGQSRMTSGFGNLIALPLQKKPHENGNSLFLDESFVPYEDQ
ncbi:MAG TPA: hypothetical protein VJG32_03400 [Anaerolineae bacterium]|nr:hypothetical protein [Anaerolineae bacterium]